MSDNDTKLGMGVSLYNKLNDYSDYDKQSMGGRLLFGYPLGEYTNLSWHYRLHRLCRLRSPRRQQPLSSQQLLLLHR